MRSNRGKYHNKNRRVWRYAEKPKCTGACEWTKGKQKANTWRQTRGALFRYGSRFPQRRVESRLEIVNGSSVNHPIVKCNGTGLAFSPLYPLPLPLLLPQRHSLFAEADSMLNHDFAQLLA